MLSKKAPILKDPALATDVSYFSGWDTRTYTCTCGWSGRFEEGSTDIEFGSIYVMNCPRCGAQLETVVFPTAEEVRAHWDRLSDEEKARQAEFVKRADLRDASRITEDREFPDLPGDELRLEWILETDENDETWVVIRHGDVVVAREVAMWDGARRFVKVVEILARRYGDRLRDVRPVGKAQMYLDGDSTTGGRIVAQARRRLSGVFGRRG